MDSHKCSSCFYFDDCGSREFCKDYYPINEDDVIEELIDERRAAFREEWFEYVEQAD